jgi:hypothetical protein
MPEDQILICRECRQEFVFSPGEQQFFAEKGFMPPKRCSACREARREREGRALGAGVRPVSYEKCLSTNSQPRR